MLKLLISTLTTFTEEKPWHSCIAKNCDLSFCRFSGLIDHISMAHNNVKLPQYPCALKKYCVASFASPQDWIMHIASSHPEIVRNKDLEYFENYFLKH